MQDGLDGVVRQPVEAKLDTRTCHHWFHLAGSLPDHHRQLWLRVCADDPAKSAVVSGLAFCHQSCGQLDLHANSVRNAESPARRRGHLARLGDNHLDDGGRLEALQVGDSCASALLRLGVDCDGVAVVDDVDELASVKLKGTNAERRRGSSGILSPRLSSLRRRTD